MKLLGMIGLLWVLFEIVRGRVDLSTFYAPQAKALWLFVSIITVSSLISGSGLMAMLRSIATVSFLPIVVTAVRNEENLRRVLKVAIAAMILAFPYGYRLTLQYGARFGIGLNESNYLALALVLLIPLAFVFARQEENRGKKLFWIGGLGILLLELILTGSRGGFLGAMFVLGLLGIRLVRRRMLAFGAIALGILILLIVPNRLTTRLLASGIDSSVQDAGTKISDGMRLSLLKAGLRMVQAHPFIGIGVDQFKSQSGAYGAKDPRIAHNTYLEIAAELGLPALLAFLNVYWVTFLSLRRSRHEALAAGRSDLADLCLAIAIGIAGYALSATFLSAQFENYFWFIVFLSICLERVAANLTPQKEQEIQHLSSVLHRPPSLKRKRVDAGSVVPI